MQDTTPVWETITAEAAAESPLWKAATVAAAERDELAVFSPLGEDRFALALESIYEGYLLHYGRPRLFAPDDGDTAVLLGDYLYAHGLVRLAAHGDVGAVTDLAELISLCTQLRADRAAAGLDGLAWAATAALLGRGEAALEEARAALRHDRDGERLRLVAGDEAGSDAVERALAAHRTLVE